MDARLISNLNELHALRYVKWRQTFIRRRWSYRCWNVNLSPRASPYRETPLAHYVSCHCCGYGNRYYWIHVNCYYLISFYVFQAISKLNMDNNYSAILQERRNILHLNNLYVLRRCMQVAILFKILTCQPTWYIREVYSGLPERPEIVRLAEM